MPTTRSRGHGRRRPHHYHRRPHPRGRDWSRWNLVAAGLGGALPPRLGDAVEVLRRARPVTWSVCSIWRMRVRESPVPSARSRKLKPARARCLRRCEPVTASSVIGVMLNAMCSRRQCAVCAGAVVLVLAAGSVIARAADSPRACGRVAAAPGGACGAACSSLWRTSDGGGSLGRLRAGFGIPLRTYCTNVRRIHFLHMGGVSATL